MGAWFYVLEVEINKVHDSIVSRYCTLPTLNVYVRQRARERTKTRVSLAGQIHCGYLTQLHVGAGPVRE